MKPDRAPNSIWCLSRANVDVAVKTGPDDEIAIMGTDFYGGPVEMVLGRREARLLAKRINQCLDETAKR